MIVAISRLEKKRKKVLFALFVFNIFAFGTCVGFSLKGGNFGLFVSHPFTTSNWRNMTLFTISMGLYVLFFSGYYASISEVRKITSYFFSKDSLVKKLFKVTLFFSILIALPSYTIFQGSMILKNGIKEISGKCELYPDSGYQGTGSFSLRITVENGQGQDFVLGGTQYNSLVEESAIFKPYSGQKSEEITSCLSENMTIKYIGGPIQYFLVLDDNPR